MGKRVRIGRSAAVAIVAFAVLVLAAGGPASASANKVAAVKGTDLEVVACASGGQDCLAAGANTPAGLILPAAVSKMVLVPITDGRVGAVETIGTGLGPTGVACPSTTSCIVVGDGAAAWLMRVTNGVPGRVEYVSGMQEIDGVACPSTTSCVAVGAGRPSPVADLVGMVVSINDGKAGSPVRVAGTFGFQGIACSSASSCVAITDAGLVPSVVPITNGVPGTPQVVGPPPGAVGPPPSFQFYLYGVACAGGTFSCVAVGDLSNAYSQDGVTVPIIGGIAEPFTRVPGTQLNAVSCESAASCLAAGNNTSGIRQGVLAPITSGTPAAVEPVSGAIEMNGVACPDATGCFAVGATDTGGVVDAVGKPFGGSRSISAALAGVLSASGSAASIPAIRKSGGYPAVLTAPTAGTLKITWAYLPPDGRLSRVIKPIEIARGSRTFASAAGATVEVRLTFKGRALLRRSKRVKLTVVASFAPKHGRETIRRRVMTLS